MRRLAAILLLCILGWSSLLKIGVVAWYQCNKSYIAQNLCENRDKPALKCCGKCYLRKQLAKTEARRSTGANPLPAQLSRIELPAFIMPPALYVVRSLPVAGLQEFPVYTHPFAEVVSMPVLHPPG